MDAIEGRQWWTAEGGREPAAPKAGGLLIVCHCDQVLTLVAGQRNECPVCGRIWVVTGVGRPAPDGPLVAGGLAQQL